MRLEFGPVRHVNRMGANVIDCRPLIIAAGYAYCIELTIIRSCGGESDRSGRELRKEFRKKPLKRILIIAQWTFGCIGVLRVGVRGQRVWRTLPGRTRRES